MRNRAEEGHWCFHLRTMVIITMFALVVITISASSGSAEGGMINKTYRWRYVDMESQNHYLSVDLDIDEEYLDWYRTFDNDVRYQYGRMITTQDPYVMTVAVQLGSIAESQGFDARDTANMVLSFVQNIEYVTDENSTDQIEYARFPIETLADGVGDCEDKAILYANLLIDLDFEAVLFLIRTKELGHMATGLICPGEDGAYVTHNNNTYFYAETTGKNYYIGDVPDEVDTDDIEVLEAERPLTVFDAIDAENEPDEELVLISIITLVVGIALAGIGIVAIGRSRKPAPTPPPVEEGFDDMERYHQYDGFRRQHGHGRDMDGPPPRPRRHRPVDEQRGPPVLEPNERRGREEPYYPDEHRHSPRKGRPPRDRWDDEY